MLVSASLVLIISLSLSLVGCPPLSGYRATVTVDGSPYPISSMRSALLSLPGLEGPLRIEGSPSCTYYRKQLPRSGVLANVYDCHGPSSDSEKRRVYQVHVSTRTEGTREIVKQEIDSLTEEIAKGLQQAFPDANVRIKATKFGDPLI
jgi:hypothetical protein